MIIYNRTGIYKAYILFKSILKVIIFNNFYCKKMVENFTWMAIIFVLQYKFLL